MEEPPKYEEVCRESELLEPTSQRLTLALIVPPPSPADTSPNSPAHNKEAVRVEIPNEPPPPYVADDDRPLLKDEENPYRHTQQAQQSLEQKLVQAGLLSESDLQEENGTALGNDLIFIIAFSLGFLFNWIGFLFAYCLCFSIAGRYGAISGMGASMIKWTFIAMYTDCCDEYMRSATCLMVALLLCGVLILGRGIYMYAKIKNQIAKGISPNRIVWYHM